MAIINITDASGIFETNVEPTWGLPSDAAIVATPSEDINPITGLNIKGRGAHMASLYNAANIGLDGYNPRETFKFLMQGNDATLALGATATAGAGQYFGASVNTDHLTYAQAPDLGTVSVTALNIPNPYVPDISAGQAVAADYKKEFESKHSGIRNSYPPVGAKPGDPLITDNTMDLSAGDGTLNPSATKARLGGWMSDTTLEFGRWQAE